MKRLVFVRHAIAIERETFVGDDALRPLTEEGRERAEDAFRRVFSRLDPNLVLTSPYRRATQTAELVQAALPRRVRQIETDGLLPDTTWPRWQAALQAATAAHPAEEIVVVGHEPSLGSLFARHLGLEAPVPFKKAGIGIVDREGTLIAFLPPRFLRS